MDAYIYQAALYCEPCGKQIRHSLLGTDKCPADPDDEGSYDSDDFPKGPYPEGGGEADSAQHCDACHKFLENDLTEEGRRDVTERIESALCAGKGESQSVALNEWLPFYDVTLSPKAIRFGRMTPAMHEHADKETGELDTFADGGYPLFYIACSDDVVCPKCANDHETGLGAFGISLRDRITAYDVNWEDPELYCDCGERIPSAYAEDEREKGQGDVEDTTE